MINDIEFLETICERMQQVGLVQSKGEFSTRMLGKGSSYLTSMSARDRKVPDEVMVYLASQLQGDVADDDNALAVLHEEARNRQHDRKHRGDMLGWVESHKLKESVRELPRQQPFVAPLSFWQKLSGWMSRGRVVMP